MLRSGLSISMAFQNSRCSTAWNGRFEDIKKTVSYSLQAAWVDTEMSFVLEAYVYYQFVLLVLRIINLQLQIAT
jgi:hypothetical protein